MVEKGLTRKTIRKMESQKIIQMTHKIKTKMIPEEQVAIASSGGGKKKKNGFQTKTYRRLGRTKKVSGKTKGNS